MNVEWSIKLGDIAIVLATIIAPFAAIQAQKYLERGRDKERQRAWVFRTLMQTRAQALSPAHIDALNTIPLDFHGEKEVVEAWRQYFLHLQKPADATEGWGLKRVELLTDLLHKIATTVGLSFEKSQIQSEIYSPNAQVDLDIEQTIIRRGLVKIFQGEPLPIKVTGLPVNETAAKEIEALRSLLIEWLSGKRAAPMEIKENPPTVNK